MSADRVRVPGLGYQRDLTREEARALLADLQDRRATATEPRAKTRLTRAINAITRQLEADR